MTLTGRGGVRGGRPRARGRPVAPSRGTKLRARAGRLARGRALKRLFATSWRLVGRCQKDEMQSPTAFIDAPIEQISELMSAIRIAAPAGGRTSSRRKSPNIPRVLAPEAFIEGRLHASEHVLMIDGLEDCRGVSPSTTRAPA